MIETLDYDAVRMLRFRQALLDFFRRWGLYVVIGLAVFGAGSNAPLTIAAAAATWLLWPLRIAAEHGWTVVPATIGYALAGALPVVCTRQLWWPRHWAEAERALPLTSATLRRSDRRFALAVMLPWQSALVVGGIGVLVGGVSHLQAGPRALGAWCVSACGSVWLSSLWMRRVRRRAGKLTVRPLRIASRPARPQTFGAMGAARALVLLPLARGRATRSATALVLGTFATSACATGPLWPPVPTGWSLSLLALVALVATSLLRACTTRELQPLWRANPQLPMPRAHCESARLAVVLVPVIVGVCLCIACAAIAPRPLRPNVLAAFGLVVAVACAIEATTRKTMDPTHHASRWILLLATAVAFASEVAPS